MPTRPSAQYLEGLRAERFELMEKLAKLPSDMIFFTQITMEAAEDPAFLAAMKAARIKGALVGVEAVTPEGLKDVYKDFNYAGETLVERLRAFKDAGVHVLGSFIFGLPSRSAPDVRGDLRDRDARRRDVRAVRDADAVSRHGRLRRLGEDDGVGHDADRRGAAHAPLADSAGAAAEGLHAAPGDGSGRDPPAHAGGLGRLLQPAEGLGAIELRRSR